MELTRFNEANEFYRRAERFLLAHEAEHNLLLGLCTTLMRHLERVEQRPYLATVEAGGATVGAAIRTPPHNLVLSLMPAGAVAPIAEDVRRQYATLPGVLAPTGVSRAFVEHWQRLSGQSYRKAVAERIYRLEAVTPVSGVPGAIRRATEADRDLLVAWLAAFYEEALGQTDRRQAERTADARLTTETAGMYLWEDGRPVSMAGYSGPTPNGIRVAPVYTPPALRGRGYASACVAALSRLLLDGGRRSCFLFTDRSNPTSNRIYQAIGYRPVCDVDEYRFAPPPGAGGR